MKSKIRYRVTSDTLNTTQFILNRGPRSVRERGPRFSSFGRTIKPIREISPTSLHNLLAQKAAISRKPVIFPMQPLHQSFMARAKITTPTNVSVACLAAEEENYCVAKSRVHSRFGLTLQAKQLLIDVRAKERKSWLKSRQAHCQHEFLQRSLDEFAKSIYLTLAGNSKLLRISELGDYLISLGACPNLQFLYKVSSPHNMKLISATLGISVAEVKANNQIKQLEFLKLIAFMPKSEVMLRLLDTEARKKKGKRAWNAKDSVSSICKQLFTYIRRLSTAYKIKGDDYVFVKNILSKLMELYSISECKVIAAYAKQLATNSQCTTNKSIKSIILKEYNIHKRNESFNFPHAQILDHSVIL
eukprot:TRINITY_DN12890_c0_g3_i1.p1 TRINITY_DN12890_c0_g3~~TRINITY_DN12890_c0_g3_i1.p1  ORF type:complete len:359 (+),score=38.61 TRINITY_DN12890_c0_g3_i1:135-1211(+)